MTTFTLFSMVLGLHLAANAQTLAIISDKDGFVNVRKEKSINSPVIGKIYRDEIFSYDEEGVDESKWIRIYKQNSESNGLDGFIYKNRMFPISKFNSIKRTKFYKDSCAAISDSLTIKITSKSFNPKFHKLTYNKPPGSSNGYNELVRIDGRHIWGTDGNLPKALLSKVVLIKNGKLINIPKSAFNDLYEPNLKSLKVYIRPNNVIYIELHNSDGAGAYTIIWIFKDNKYSGRYIDNSIV